MLERTTHRARLVGATTSLAVITAALAIAADDPPGSQPDPPRSLVQRGARAPGVPPAGLAPPAGAATYPFEFRTVDGTLNNVANPMWGAAGITLLRTTPVGYDNGTDTPAGPDRPSARLVSNMVAAQDESLPNAMGLSAYVWQWGQFLDHDIDETPVTDPGEPFDIPVPAGDPSFDPDRTGTAVIPLDRSAWATVDGIRRQLNNITSFIDASNVYGSDADRALELRALDGTGRLKTSPGDLLPFNVNGFDNAPDPDIPTFFLAGDIRANEQVALTAMHTLFVREHNQLTDMIRADEPGLTGDEVYLRARALVGAEVQAITYREFLPRLLGPSALPPYAGYLPDVDPGISNVFATAAYRVGHTMLSPVLMRIDASGEDIPAGHLALANAFFSPDEITQHGIDSLLRGLARQPDQEVDTMVIDDVRNFLFGPPGKGGFDLASLNIQRGRDHGLATYNQVRESFGRPPVASFAEISPDPDVQARLVAAYDDVDDIDAWIGLLAEPHRAGAFVGETLFRVLRDQFTRLRDGDRFWYEAYLPRPLVQMAEQQTLAMVIRRNADIGPEIQNDVFVVADPCAADRNGDGVVGQDDLNLVLAAWGQCPMCPEDINGDGRIAVEELLMVIGSWGPCE